MANNIEELFKEFCENQCQEQPENKRYHMACINCKAEEFADWLEQTESKGANDSTGEE